MAHQKGGKSLRALARHHLARIVISQEKINQNHRGREMGGGRFSDKSSDEFGERRGVSYPQKLRDNKQEVTD